MNTITISKQVHEFLASAIDPKPHSNPQQDRPYLRYFLATDAQRVVTTDGFRMHIWPVEDDYTPGYYQFNRDLGMLTRVDDSYVEKKEFYLVENLYYPRILGAAKDESPLMIYSCGMEHIAPICIDEFPKVTHKKDKKHTVNMTFRKGIVAGEMRSVCLGINALSLEWGEDGLVNPVGLDKTIILDAKYVLDVLVSSVVSPCMRFVSGHNKPAIIGNMDNAHAVIMPMGKRR